MQKTKKICYRCKVEKDINSFHNNKIRTDGRSPYCKQCKSTITREYYNKNSARIIKRTKKYQTSPYGRFISYGTTSKQRNIKFNLTFEQFMTFWQKPCYYCGDKIETIGLDRIDNNKRYEIENVVSCCQHCNYMKMDWTEKEFINQCRKITDRFKRSKK